MDPSFQVEVLTCGLGFRGLGFRVRVYGLGFRVRVYGLGFRSGLGWEACMLPLQTESVLFFLGFW